MLFQESEGSTAVHMMLCVVDLLTLTGAPPPESRSVACLAWSLLTCSACCLPGAMLAPTCSSRPSSPSDVLSCCATMHIFSASRTWQECAAMYGSLRPARMRPQGISRVCGT